jgi:prepilin-type N-terminal cleavage/methylation domain-containing protein
VSQSGHANFNFLKDVLMKTKSFSPRKARQAGFTLIEIIIALAVMGSAIGGMLYYQSRAETSQKTNDAVSALTTMVSSVKTNYGPAGTYAGVTVANIIAGGLTVEPLKVSGANIVDPWNNNVLAEGAAAQFAMRVGPLTRETCLAMANGLVRNAVILNVGNVTAVTAGALTGGGVYKASAAATPDAGVLNGNTGCGIANDAQRFVAATFS